MESHAEDTVDRFQTWRALRQWRSGLTVTSCCHPRKLHRAAKLSKYLPDHAQTLIATPDDP